MNVDDETTRFLRNVRSLRSFVHHAEVGAELTSLLTELDSLMISVMHFNDEKSGAPYSEVSILAMQGAKRRSTVRKDLLTGLLAIAGKEKMKPCTHCKESKVLSAFSVNKRSADGRNCICLVCVRGKVAKYHDEKKKRDRIKAAAIAKVSEPSPPVSQEHDQG